MIRTAQKNITGPMNAAEAQAITNRIRNTVDQLWSLLLEAHDRRAWRALGHTSWEAYVTSEFGMTRQHSYRLLDQGRVIHAIEEAAGKVSPSGDISEAAARDIKPVLSTVTAQIKQRVQAGEAPEAAVEEAVDAAREAKAMADAERNARQAEHDKQRDKHAAKLPAFVAEREQAKAETIAAVFKLADVEALIAEIEELREATAALEADVARLTAENKLYGEMKVQFEQGGFDKVIAGKDAEINALQTRLYSESADKASWMKSAKYWKAEAEKLGWTNGDFTIDLETGEIADV